MTSPTPKRGLFPPRMGWVPLIVALAAVTVASIWAVSPQFSNQIVGAVNGQAGTGPAAGPTAGAVADGGPSAAAQVGGPAGVAGGQAGKVGPGQQNVAGGAQCAAGKNGGSTGAPGVSGTSINIASTIVTTGEGSGFLGEAVSGMQAAINEANNAGGVCGRRISLSTVNDDWNPTTGQTDIANFINQGNVFALVGEPDSEGLGAAIDSGAIGRAQIPVVGTDGMLKDQYNQQWVWPVAASTVSNMHIAAQYAVQKWNAKHVGIVFDTSYKFGKEGAAAFDQEMKRLTGSDINGYAQNADGNSCVQAYCGIQTNGQTDFSSAIHTLNSACNPCDAVMMLLEPKPMETWMQADSPANCGCTWYKHLAGGEPLFDDNLGSTCGGNCSAMTVFTGYHPAIQPFDAEKPVYTYAQSLRSVCPSCDAHNEFTEGAYLGTKLFIEACKQVGPNLTRDALRQVLNSATFDLGLTNPLRFGNNQHLANTSMAGFADNAPPNGSFNGWNYLATGFLNDPAPGQDMQ
ncbi:MAG TPA: ABC transporter substrate-binding protein [Candidatus Angelobacter sp.]|jgi:ABC-type branched-subunit amino acid transport system substrate-binding protein|nr:ABC transporter substrate-binding protein [Candidatus Angelobacter sp.]